MNVIVIASSNNYEIKATIQSILREKLSNSYIFRFYAANIGLFYRADVFIAVIDKNYTTDNDYKFLIDKAYRNYKEKKNVGFIQVSLDGTTIPSDSFIPTIHYSEDNLKMFKVQLSFLFKKISSVNKDEEQENEEIINTTHNGINYQNKFELLLTFMMYVTSLFLIVVSFIPYQIDLPNYSFIITIFMLIMSTSMLLIITKRRKSKIASYEIKSYNNKINSISDSSSNKTLNAINLMEVNLHNIKEYYIWSQNQAKSSLTFAIVMSILGFILFFASIFLYLKANASIEVLLITGLGGAITELLAGTVLFVYKNSLTQLNHYHSALHEDERFLSCVNLVNNLHSKDAQDDMIKELIRNEISLNVTNNHTRETSD